MAVLQTQQGFTGLNKSHSYSSAQGESDDHETS